MKKSTIFLLIALAFLLQSCALMFSQSPQSVNVNASDTATTVYLNHKKVSEGTTTEKARIVGGVHQIRLKTENYKDEYTILTPIPGKRKFGFYVGLLIDIPTSMFFFFTNILVDFTAPAPFKFAKNHTFTHNPSYKYQNRLETDKYIDLYSIGFDITDFSKDIVYYNAEFDKKKKTQKYEAAESKYKSNSLPSSTNTEPKSKFSEDEKKEIKLVDDYMSNKVFSTLRKNGFIDTTNKVFHDNNNTLALQGSVNTVSVFSSDAYNTAIKSAKVSMKWYIKNTYGEIEDSIISNAYSGIYVPKFYYDDKLLYSMVADAVETSFINVLQEDKLKSMLPINTSIKIKKKVLGIPAPTSVITDISDADLASVVIKRKDEGHGSGFAITNNGYIITNYHVIAGKYKNAPEELTVILPNKEEVPARVVRYNKMTDIALLKVNATFDKVFALPTEKNFKKIQEMYAMGAPKSIELGQSVSMGIVSNERKVNNLTYLQLNMSVNSGNSGGPLFDKSAQLQGVVTSKLGGFNTEGVCFAVPAYLLASYLKIKFK